MVCRVSFPTSIIFKFYIIYLYTYIESSFPPFKHDLALTFLYVSSRQTTLCGVPRKLAIPLLFFDFHSCKKRFQKCQTSSFFTRSSLGRVDDIISSKSSKPVV